MSSIKEIFTKSNLTIVDYLNQYDFPFNELHPFNYVDAFLLSIISYFPFERIIEDTNFYDSKQIEIKINNFEEQISRKVEKKTLDLLHQINNSKRYKNILFGNILLKVSEESDQQFFVISIIVDNFIFVSFRGTDATLLGWKEDIDLSYKKHIPSQIEGCKYLSNLLKSYPSKTIYVGGHSKGGNVAVYSSAMDPENDRIEKVFSFDGPGFNKHFCESEQYLSICDKVIKVVPEEDVIGQLLHDIVVPLVIKSNAHSLMQHEEYSWLVNYNDFVYADKINQKCILFGKELTRFVENEDNEKKKIFCETLFEIAKKLNIVEFKDAKYNLLMFARCFKQIIPTYEALDDNEKQIIKSIILDMIKLYRKSAFESKIKS